MNTLEVHLPALGERQDIEAIARHLLTVYAPGFQLTPGAVAHLKNHAWPGNIRELRNELLRASLSAADGVIDRVAIEAACIRHADRAVVTPAPGSAAAAAASDSDAFPEVAALLRDAQSELVRTTFAETGGNISLTARRLGVSRNKVYRILSKSGRGTRAARQSIDAS
jgi:DNA-binding NtrC family response regulator